MRRIFDVAGQGALQQQARCVKYVLPLLVTTWLGMCTMMLTMTRTSTPVSNVIQITLSAVLVVVQTLLSSHAVSDGSNRANRIKYKMSFVQLLLQTFLGLSTLTTFIFRANGLSIGRCIASLGQAGSEIGRADTWVLCGTLLTYVSSLGSVLVQISEYNRLRPDRPHPEDAVTPRRRLLKATQVVSLLCNMTFMFLTIAEFFNHGYVISLVALAINLQLMAVMLQRHWGTRPSWEDFHEIERHMFNFYECVEEDVNVVIMFTYVAGLSGVITILSANGIGSSSMSEHNLVLMFFGLLSHLLVSIGYYVGMKTSMGMVRLALAEEAREQIVRMQARPLELVNAHKFACDHCQENRPPRPSAEIRETACKFCSERTSRFLALPCGHFGVCGTCKPKCSNSCPLCTTTVHDWYPVFIP